MQPSSWVPREDLSAKTKLPREGHLNARPRKNRYPCCRMGYGAETSYSRSSKCTKADNSHAHPSVSAAVHGQAQNVTGLIPKL